MLSFIDKKLSILLLNTYNLEEIFERLTSDKEFDTKSFDFEFWLWIMNMLIELYVLSNNTILAV